MAIENTISIDFDLRSTIVKSIFDCRLPGVLKFIVSNQKEESIKYIKALKGYKNS